MADRDRGEDATGAQRHFVSALLRSWLLPALLVCSLITIAALLLRVGGVETELADRAAARLADAGASWAWVEVAGRDLTLHGRAPTEAEQRAALDAVGGTWGLGVLVDATQLIPLVAPYVWSAERRDGAIILAGGVPSEEIRAEFLRFAGTVFPGMAVDDRAELARGAGETFVAGAEFALRVLASLARGAVTVVGTEVTIAGTAVDSVRFEDIGEAVRAGLPAGYTVAASEILPPLADPYAWAVLVTDAGVRLVGFAPDAASRAAIAAGVAAAFPGRPVEDVTILGSGAPEGFLADVDHVLLLATHLATGEVSLRNGEVSLAGQARDPDAYQDLLALIAQPGPPGLSVVSDAVGPGVAQSYILQARRAGGGIELIGYMPNPAARAEVVAEAQRLFGAGRVTDRLQIADGAPAMDWVGAAKFVLMEAVRLSDGAATLNATVLSIAGTAASSDAFEAIGADLAAGTLPSSLTLGSIAVEPPPAAPYRFSVALGPAMVTLAGNAPSLVVRTAHHTAAEAGFRPLTIADETRIASGMPAGFDTAAAAVLQAATRLISGRAEMVDRAVTLSGVAPHEGAVARITDQLRAALPAGYTLDAQLQPKPLESRIPAAECQALADAELAAGSINFAAGSARIAADSEGRLDRLVAIVLRCPEAPVEIGGHTDSEGGTNANRTLSQRRAEAVVEFLTVAGVSGDRLTAVGYGETQPIADNDTPEGRLRNRRIAFTIREP